MPRIISDAAKRSVNASATGEVWLSLVELENANWAEPVRLVRDTTDVVSGGNTYLAFPFDISLPDEEAEQQSVVNFVAYTANSDLIAQIRSASDVITGRVFWVLASSPEVIEISFVELEIRVIDYDDKTISGSMVIEPVMDSLFGSRLMDNVNTPGLL